MITRLVRVPSYILANLVIGENIVPELLQEDCTPEKLAAALVPLIGDTPERRRQVEAFARLDAIMEIGSRAPAARAADIVLGSLRRPNGRPEASGQPGHLAEPLGFATMQSDLGGRNDWTSLARRSSPRSRSRRSWRSAACPRRRKAGRRGR